MKISEFKPGDIVTRTQPIKKPCNMGLSSWGGTTIIEDYSYVGDRLEYRGTANGMIYTIKTSVLKPEEEKTKATFFAARDSEGWELWVNPDTMNVKGK